MSLVLLACSGCTSGPSLALRPPANPSRATIMSHRVERGGPVRIAAKDREAVWDEVVEVVGRHFELEAETRGETIGDNLLAVHDPEPEAREFEDLTTQPEIIAAGHTAASPHRSQPSGKRRAFIHMEEKEDGFVLDLKVFQDATASELPESVIAQTGSVDAQFPTLEEETGRGMDDVEWRDEQLEIALLDEVRQELGEASEYDPLDEWRKPEHGFRYLGATLHTNIYRIPNDWKNFYSLNSMAAFGVAFGLGAVLANQRLDEKIDAWYQDDVRSESTDKFIAKFKWMGDGTYTFPLLGAIMLTSGLADFPLSDDLNEWSMRTMRGFAVGLVPMLVMQRVVGTGRPGRFDTGSQWTPFERSNGVSGDAFMSSMPWITAAKMADNFWLKSTFYTMSLISPIGRVNDHDHYFSQAMLGWFIGYLSAHAVTQTELQFNNCTIVPVVMTGGMGVGIEYRR